MNNEKNNKPMIPLIIISAVLVVAIIFVFVQIGNTLKSSGNIAKTEKNIDSDGEEDDDQDEKVEKTEETSAEVSNEVSMARPSFLGESGTVIKSDYVANTAEYSVKPDLSDVYNLELYYFDDEYKKMLADNLFLVSKPYGEYEFFEVYERNRYYYESSFITVDSLMHTYHLFFSHLLKNLEKNELASDVANMSVQMFNESNNQYAELKGTEWEKAAKRNVIFFGVGATLSGQNVNADSDVMDAINVEVSKINNAEGIDTCVVSDNDEDYTQYKPRGYYDGDALLEQYFRTMMWYGRIQFNTKSDEMIKSSALMSIAINETSDEIWRSIYDITSFFCGASDDLTYYEYYPALQEVYGSTVSTADLTDDSKFEDYVKKVKALRLPAINSIPIQMGEDNTIQGFRFMGQRFTIDAAIMQELIYSRVDANGKGELRMLPDVLDVAAALGSDVAYDLLKEQGDTEFTKYTENMDMMRNFLSADNSEASLSNSLYGSWINTLRPLLKEKGKGYPSFMQSKEWAKKDIETFAGSYTELKHDTVLYAKQVMAEMGDGEIPEFDDRGYVQPEPEVYARFKYLAGATRKGLEDRNKISAEDSEALRKLEELADSFVTISEKELKDEVLTDDEYDLIREYGGILEHFWYDITKADTGDDEINTEKYQAALCVDVATDPNGAVLEMATGQPCIMYVIVKVDDKVKIAKGVAYSFYQFEWPMNDRLTDSKWRQMMGFEPGADGFYSNEYPKIDIPWWTEGYSHVYRW